MTTKGQTHAKRARELELKERRERKLAKKAVAAAQRAAGKTPANGGSAQAAEVNAESVEWIR